MTLENLLDDLKAFLQEDLKEIRLPVNPKSNEDTAPRAFTVYKMGLPEPEDWEGRIPYIILQMLNGTDSEKENTVKVRILITLFNRDREEGRMTLLHVVQKLRLDLQRKGVIGRRFVLQQPFEYLFYTDDTGPYHLAEIMTVFSVPPIERDVFGLHNGYYE